MGDYKDKRAQFDGMAAGLQQLWPPVEGVDVENITIPGPEDSETEHLPLRIYKPTATATSPLPTVVWYHGGGWTCGTLDSEDAQCRLIAVRTPCLIVSVGYGLLPENTTAGLLADCLAGLDWARAHATTHGGSANQLLVLGGSAGGALALERALVEVGAAVRREHYEGLPHYFWFFPQLARTEGFLADVAEGVRWVLREGEEGGLVVHGV
ncbi:hypothetical protein SLS56_008012 [Neofusicoccum ribis]|uniref:Alpha/beta hydrolase fold-3 domain-containing protein n=1 Tax=Neofusicoccum ribis TaxID=45134 RepID=A0ABR3SLF4_9PEZI